MNTSTDRETKTSLSLIFYENKKFFKHNFFSLFLPLFYHLQNIKKNMKKISTITQNIFLEKGAKYWWLQQWNRRGQNAIGNDLLENE